MNANGYSEARPGAIPGTEARGGPPIRIDPWLVPHPGAPVTNSSLNSTNVHINGGINVHTPATDAQGIASDLHDAVTDAFVQQANRGLQ